MNLMTKTLCGLSLFALAACGSYSDGERAGVVSKLSNKGLVCKTWEGELLMGGLRTQTDSEGQSSTVANIFEFSVLEDEIAEELNTAMLSGDRVSIVYEQFLLPAPCSRDTSYVIVDVKTLR